MCNSKQTGVQIMDWVRSPTLQVIYKLQQRGAAVHHELETVQFPRTDGEIMQ